MKRDKIKEKYIKLLFNEVENEKLEEYFENYEYNIASINYDIYVFNKKYYKLKNFNENLKKELLLYLFRFNFYVPRIIRRIIFKRLLIYDESKDTANFNYKVYLLLSFLKNPNINEATQKTVDLDVFRTRIDKQNEKTIYFFNIFLNYACSHFQFKYKQGLNEVLALFFHLKGKCFNMIDVYFCFQNFVQRFLKEFYYDDEFFFLQISFYLFKILIKYHDPALSEILENNKMNPEIYAASWFLTLFASKSDLEILNSIYLIFLLERNPFFFFFFSLALLILHRNVFMCVDSSNLPELLSKINIFDKIFLKKVWSLGKYLEKNTPVSFTHKLFFIKNILIYLTNENSAENDNKKNLLLNFFKSIDYMSINSYEIIKNISLGNNNYIFLDIRPSRHFKNFHLKNSINIDFENNYEDIIKRSMNIKNPQKKENKILKNILYICYILKKYDNHEIGYNYLLLFSFLLCSKYNKKINISYDDNIILKKIPPSSNDPTFDTSKWENKTGRNEKQQNNKMEKNVNERKLEGMKNRGNINNGHNSKKKNTEIGNILHLEENKVVDLNLFFFNLYKNKKYYTRQNKMINIDNNSRKKRIIKNGSVKNILEPLKYMNIINYIREKKLKDLKSYYSDDDAIVDKFSLTSYHIKKQLNEKVEKENKKKGRSMLEPIKREKNTHRGPLINNFSIDENNNDNEISKDKKCFTNKDEENMNNKKSDDTNYRSNSSSTSSESNNERRKSNEIADPKLNISSFSLYVLIKEKVLKYEELLKVSFENILSPDKEILILYDDDLNNSKYVRTLYYYLLYTYQIRKVSIIEGGINSYHTLIENDSFFKQIEKNTINGRVVEDTIENNNYEDHLNFYLHYYNFLKDENVLRYCFHQSNVCYLCNYPIFQKKFIDDFFSEIYNDYPIFEEVYYFLTYENICINLLSFYDLIIRKKKTEKIKYDKKNNSDGALSHFSKIFNYIKKKKEPSSLSIPSSTWTKDSVSYNGRYNIGVEKDNESFFSNKKNNFLANKNYFSLNYYLDYYYKKGKTDFPFDPANSHNGYETEMNKNGDMNNSGTYYNLRDKMNEKHLYDHEENQKKIDETTHSANIYAYQNSRKSEIDNKYVERNEILNKNGNEQMDEEKRKDLSLDEKITNLPMFTNNADKKNVIDFDIYNIYSYIDVVCYNSLLEKCSDGYKDEKIYNEKNLKKANGCKIFNCFISYVYQPIIPHNIRSNNIINNFVEYVKYYKSTISNINNNNIATDPNLYLNCNKLDPKLFLNTPYLPYTSFRQPKYEYHKDNAKQSIEKEDTSSKRNSNSTTVDDGSQNNLEKNERTNINDSDLQNSKAYNDLLNNSILNNTWIKNRPDLSSCKLMIYDNLLILYGAPYICDTDIIVRNLNEIPCTESDMNDKKNNNLCAEESYANNLVNNDISSEMKNANGKDQINDAKENGEKENGEKESAEKESMSNNLDIGTRNFLKENEKYRNKKGNKSIDLNSCDDKLEKIIIHKYKDLKKKDVLFNIDCYKLNSIDINWVILSNNIFHSITNDHISDIYDYYESYFNLSKSNMPSKEIIYSSSSLSSSNLISHIPDEQDYSFSDYHNLYTKNLKEKNNINKTEIFHYKNVKIDAVNIYAIFDIRSIYKITTKRMLGKTLYFYFKINESTPLMALNFENDAEMQSCVCSVKEVHTMLSKEKK
ncbi:TBC domain-containing protein, putative [Plasmodium chabaudi chabaudi]|uniref:TBC domain-containing protein, putative n=1 Tax=Plasmodium chabaudi chabaudi TaxID=31271 RepID=A0A4V0KCV1_PLACU|nr:TBC domain-containing protein, putative [Plasmodium chabaudi chabaudi]VTZ71144.1 TBC domain-containing protein, putative [Plasmodium chabaudi chabaudi]|eukprot:XP_016655006.1 conserved Plasmodium protein, unknown function [Plasmodium chabaudi chabaudi]